MNMIDHIYALTIQRCQGRHVKGGSETRPPGDSRLHWDRQDISLQDEADLYTFTKHTSTQRARGGIAEL